MPLLEFSPNNDRHLIIAGENSCNGDTPHQVAGANSCHGMSLPWLEFAPTISGNSCGKCLCLSFLQQTEFWHEIWLQVLSLATGRFLQL
jgi:hypothetical protein